jgi:hypothetical protein
MRKTLYMKDDDYRLSFLHGNFVTLTNLEEADWQRLEEQRLRYSSNFAALARSAFAPTRKSSSVPA